MVGKTRSDAEHPCPSCGHPTEITAPSYGLITWACEKCGAFHSECHHERTKKTILGPDSWEVRCAECDELLGED